MQLTKFEITSFLYCKRLWDGLPDTELDKGSQINKFINQRLSFIYTVNITS